MNRLAYLYDQHSLTAGEVAAAHVYKCWSPVAPYVQVFTAGPPVLSLSEDEEWWLFHAAVSVSSVLGYLRQGHQVKLYMNGAPSHGGILLDRSSDGVLVFKGFQPTAYGFAWGLWPGGTLVAGDVVETKACYRVVTRRRGHRG